MKKRIIKVTLLSLAALSIIGCSSSKPDITKASTYKSTLGECKIENVKAPKWACIPEVSGFYAGVGVAEKSSAGIAHMRKVALMNGRSDLSQQIQTKVKDKIEGFTRATGNGSNEAVDKVTTAVTKQLAKIDLKNSKAVDYWESPSGAIYMLVTIPEANVNASVKDTVKSSFKDDNALWQQFQSKQALEKLDQEFPTE